MSSSHGKKGKFIKGFILGSAVAFFLGYNYGRDMPLLSVPTIAKTAIEKAEGAANSVRNSIHQATIEPEQTASK